MILFPHQEYKGNTDDVVICPYNTTLYTLISVFSLVWPLWIWIAVLF